MNPEKIFTKERYGKTEKFAGAATSTDVRIRMDRSVSILLDLKQMKNTQETIKEIKDDSSIEHKKFMITGLSVSTYECLRFGTGATEAIQTQLENLINCKRTDETNHKHKVKKYGFAGSINASSLKNKS